MWNKFKALGPNAQDLLAALMVTVFGLALGLTLSALTGCTPDQPAPVQQVIQPTPVAAPVVAGQAQPVVVVQQPAAQHSGVGDFMMGALVGHALSGGGGGYHPAPVVHQTTVVNKTVNVTKVAPQPRAYVSPRMATPSYSRSTFSGGRRR